MLRKRSYIEAIGEGFPAVKCDAAGDGTAYEDMNWVEGDPLPSKEVLDTWILADIKARVWKLIQEERDTRKAGGLYIASADKWFHSDDTSRIQYLGLLMMGAGLPAGIMWKTMSGAFIEMTPTLAGQIFQTMASKDIAIFTAAEQHRAALYASSSSPETYDWTVVAPAWPPKYGE